MEQRSCFTASASSSVFYPPSSANTLGATNASLKTLMLQDARRERQRVLDVAAGKAASTYTEPMCAPRARALPPPQITTAPTSSEQAAQTDLVTILSPGFAPALRASTALARLPPIHEDGCGGAFLSSSPQSSGPSSPVHRDRRDEEAQAEAMQTLRSLAQSKPYQPKASSPFYPAKAVDAELQKERASRRELEMRLAGESKKMQATQEQVLCLEQEFDGKEEALQCAERALESRDTELQQAQHSLAQLRAELLATQHFLMKTTTDRDRQLSHKHQFIQSFFDMIKQQQGSILEGELSTSASSDHDSNDDRSSDRGSGNNSLDSTLCSERGSGLSLQSYTTISSMA